MYYANGSTDLVLGGLIAAGVAALLIGGLVSPSDATTPRPR